MGRFADDPDVQTHSKALQLFADYQIFPDAQERRARFEKAVREIDESLDRVKLKAIRWKKLLIETRYIAMINIKLRLYTMLVDFLRGLKDILEAAQVYL